MKLRNRLLIAYLCVLVMGFKNSVEVADKPFGSESDVARQSQPSFTMPQPLSELIVRPEEFNVPLDKDPFQPVVKVEPLAQTERKVKEEQDLGVFKEMEYAGVVKWGEKFSALIKMGETKGVYHINDKIQQWTIADISKSVITFQNGNKTYRLPRGDK